MPRISDSYLDCVVYLYSDVGSANRGEAIGGSGFLVMVPSQSHPQVGYSYAVTPSHVIREGRSPIIRMNTKQGDLAVIPARDADWFHHPDGDDVAVVALGLSPEMIYKYVHLEGFVTRELVEQHDIGPGDDIFMVGRLIAHDGRQRNLPSVRFGSLAMMPWEPLRHQTRGINQESFVIETRSIGGYSGSPVFVQIPPLASRPGSQSLSTRGRGPWLLSIDWSHFPLYEPVLESDKSSEVQEGWKVRLNTGMAGVVPAWKIADVLNLEELVAQRERGDDDLERKQS